MALAALAVIFSELFKNKAPISKSLRVNDLGNQATMAHLLKYDSVLGNLPTIFRPLMVESLLTERYSLFLSERSPADLPWADLGVDVVIESTGIFTDRDKAAMHLDAGSPFVIVSAPAGGADATFVVGVNDGDFDSSIHKVVSTQAALQIVLCQWFRFLIKLLALIKV